MTEASMVYMVRPSFEEGRPVIEFDAPVNQGIDWERLDAILLGERPITDYRELSVGVRHGDATTWGYYAVPGTLGLISGEAVRCIGRSALRWFHLLPARLNGVEYFFLAVAEVLPCLDPTKSEMVPFRTNPERIKAITKYAFDKAMIPDSIVFSIPESPGLFTTPAVYMAITGSRMSGFKFTPLG